VWILWTCVLWYLVNIFNSSIFWDTRRWIKSKSTIRSIPTHHRQNPTEIISFLYFSTFPSYCIAQRCSCVTEYVRRIRIRIWIHIKYCEILVHTVGTKGVERTYILGQKNKKKYMYLFPHSVILSVCRTFMTEICNFVFRTAVGVI
jgi:hypothetical protein